ncbi:alpha,alpha-trehalose-phosphate synthase [UDP-forming] 1-like [Bidens hawaiensis]|uniref:alpha,alpha-trehalose-phosphate synthase [UDP-forming] 1-like n=1 Tax=Bidens hawaiensis TaxID=980011 RepID=UPI00404AAE06
MDLKLHPELKESLMKLCNDPHTTVVVLSGSDQDVLDDNFGEFNVWLAAEHGMFLRSTKGTWMTTMPEHLNVEWVDSVKHVFEYFTERTPRSHFELRETSLVWNYKHADVEFGRIQTKDMLQHLWTGPISNASVDVVQGSRSVEVRAAGVTKGSTIVRILHEIVQSKSISSPIDYVLCIGHFLEKDEDIYTYFEPELPNNNMGIPRSKLSDTTKGLGDKKHCKRTSQKPQPLPSLGNRNNGFEKGGNRSSVSPDKVSWSVLDLTADNYFSCSVGRTRTKARYLLPTSDDVVSFLKNLSQAY